MHNDGTYLTSKSTTHKEMEQNGQRLAIFSDFALRLCSSETLLKLDTHEKNDILTSDLCFLFPGTVYELGKMMFESVFQENPQYLIYIDLKDEPNWMNHINFKIHVQVTAPPH